MLSCRRIDHSAVCRAFFSRASADFITEAISHARLMVKSGNVTFIYFRTESRAVDATPASSDYILIQLPRHFVGVFRRRRMQHPRS
jgi:hypothetical protein